MARLSFEDLPDDETISFGALGLSEEEIVSFARQWDPQPFHIDREAARKSMIGALCASGWHSAAMMMRLNVDGWINETHSMGTAAVREVKWVKPVLPGDTLSVRRRLHNKRASRSRPDRGFADIFCELLNQRGDIVMTQAATMFFLTRHGVAEGPQRNQRDTSGTPPVPLAPPADTATLYIEDWPIGKPLDLASHHFTQEEITAFARTFDPQPFHLDEAAARASHYGAISASGWHTACGWMRRLMATRAARDARMQAPGVRPVPAGVSPGFDDLEWLRPVYAGDTIHYRTTAKSWRETSRPGWALAFSENEGFNQFGQKVFRFTGIVFAAMRPGPARS